MGKGKPRNDPTKPQNHFGGEGKCINYDATLDMCDDHYPHFMGGVSETIVWKNLKDENDKLWCHGNRHKCYKMKLKWLASISPEERKIYQKFGILPGNKFRRTRKIAKI